MLGTGNFLFTSVTTSTYTWIYSISFFLFPLQLRQMAPPAQKSKSSNRQTKRTWKVRENDELTPVAFVPPPAIAKGLFKDPHPVFEPSNRVLFDSIYVLVPIISLLQLFLLLLGEESLATMITATNAHAEEVLHHEDNDSFRRTRPWHPLTRNELIRWLGTLVYMGRYHETNAKYY